MELKNVKVAAGAVTEDSTVLINLSGPGGPKGRISVNESLTLKELGVNPKSVNASKPVFPQSDINEITSDKTMSDEERTKAFEQVMAEYKEACKVFAAAGSATVEDQIIVAVVEHLVKNHGFSTKDKANAPVINPNELQVSTFLASGVVVYSLTANSVWG